MNPAPVDRRPEETLRVKEEFDVVVPPHAERSLVLAGLGVEVDPHRNAVIHLQCEPALEGTEEARRLLSLWHVYQPLARGFLERIFELLYLSSGEDGAVLADVVLTEHAVPALPEAATHVALH